MVGCEVDGCDNKKSFKSPEQIERENNGFKISFHKFPRTEERRKLWVDALQRENWIPDENSYVCSDHFAPECFERSDSSTYISRHAVPTIFPSDIKPNLESFEFVPFNNPNEVLRIYKSTLEKEDPLNSTNIIKEEPQDEYEEKPVVMNQVIIPVIIPDQISSDNRSHFTAKRRSSVESFLKSNTCAQTEGSPSHGYIEKAFSLARNKEEGKTMTYRKKIKILQQQIKRQSKVIKELGIEIRKIQGKM